MFGIFTGKCKHRQRLHGTGSVWNRYEIGTDKSCVYTGPGGCGTDRSAIWYQVGHEGDRTWNRTVPVSNRSRVSRVDSISNGPEVIRSRVNVAIISRNSQSSLVELSRVTYFSPIRLRLHEIGAVLFHLDRIQSGSVRLNCVGFTRSRNLGTTQ